MLFVCPVPMAMTERLLPLPRLYAYPSLPEPVEDAPLVILDSGAYGLFQRRRQMDHRYMRSLSDHYRKCGASDKLPCVGVAPDSFLRPDVTLEQFDRWNRSGFARVAPVIQFFRKGHLDWAMLPEQVQCYREYGPQVVMLSNPGLRGRDAIDLGINEIAAAVKEHTGAKWLHVLGAGWSLRDVRDWSMATAVDSIDSIAYYTSREAWWKDRGDTWDNAYANALAAGIIAAGGVLI